MNYATSRIRSMGETMHAFKKFPGTATQGTHRREREGTHEAEVAELVDAMIPSLGDDEYVVHFEVGCRDLLRESRSTL